MSDVQATDTATVEVPAQHVSTVERLIALLKKEEQTVIDNVEAGLSALENLFKSNDSAETATTSQASDSE